MTIARHIATIALFSSALATSAIAADIQQPVSDWTGWHVGAGVGYGMVNHEIDIDAPGLGTLDFSGFGGEGGLATLEAGYDLNVGSNFVLGAQVDYTYSGVSTDINGFIGGLGSADYELEATHAISAIIRGGHLINDNTLMYSLIGWTHTWWNGDLGVADNNGAPVFGASYDYDTDGLTLGGGIESAIANNTTLKLEYRYTMNEDANIFNIPGFLSIDENANVHTARAVLSYRPGVMGADFDGSEERWNGLRVGIGGGYSMINHVLEASAGPAFGAELSGIGGEGFFGTAEVGYDILLADRFVAGIQGDYSLSTASTDLDAAAFGGSLSYELEATHSASALLRAGVLSSPDVLWYGIAGYTHTWFNGDLDVPGLFSASYDFDEGGLTAGAGVEVMLTDNVSWKSEYRYTNLGDVNIFSGGGFTLDSATNIQQVRSVLTYRF